MSFHHIVAGSKLQAASSKPQACVNLRIVAGDWIEYIRIKQKGYNMDRETNGHLYIVNDNLKRIGDALEEILRLVKEDMDRSKQHYEKEKDND